jgi:RNA polymerase sigma-70 factor (ECF subfamily)
VGGACDILAGEAAMTEARERVTAIVAGWGAGDTPGRPALDALVPDLYRELRRMAQWRLGGGDQTLQATALVHEAYLKLVDQSRVDWKGRTHFKAIAAKVMRNVLVDHVRERGARKRGGDWQRVTLSPGGEPATPEMDLDQILSLHTALERLAEHDERQARVVDLRFFGGLKVEEVAAALGVSKRTAEGYWTHARAWLRRELSRGPGA